MAAPAYAADHPATWGPLCCGSLAKCKKPNAKVEATMMIDKHAER
jgi:hypothetical protein